LSKLFSPNIAKNRFYFSTTKGHLLKHKNIEKPTRRKNTYFSFAFSINLFFRNVV